MCRCEIVALPVSRDVGPLALYIRSLHRPRRRLRPPVAHRPPAALPTPTPTPSPRRACPSLLASLFPSPPLRPAWTRRVRACCCVVFASSPGSGSRGPVDARRAPVFRAPFACSFVTSVQLCSADLVRHTTIRPPIRPFILSPPIDRRPPTIHRPSIRHFVHPARPPAKTASVPICCHSFYYYF